MTLHIAIIGATGRLGRAIGAYALKDPSFQIVAALTHPNSFHLDCDYGALLHLPPLNLPVSASVSPPAPDLLIDASLPSALKQNLSLALSLQKPIVVATTGLSEADRQLLEETSCQIPLFYAANFSLGMALLHKLVLDIAQYFPSAEIDLIETHHTQKKDTPSGSALSLAKAISSARIHSIRSGQIIGEHEIRFNTPEERLTLSHQAHSREAFARGALTAARFLAQQSPGLYGMEELLSSFSCKTFSHPFHQS